MGNGETITTADISKYTAVKSKGTLSKIQDELAKRGVIQKRSKRPAVVAEKYRPAGVGNQPPESPLITDVTSALVNMGHSKRDAQKLAEAARGDDLESRIKSALKLSLPGQAA